MITYHLIDLDYFLAAAHESTSPGYSGQFVIATQAVINATVSASPTLLFKTAYSILLVLLVHTSRRHHF